MGKSNKQKSSLVKPSHPKRHPQGGAAKSHHGNQGQKPAAFRVSSHKALKAKHKTKQITSNLKWINPKASKEQIQKSDASFSDLYHSLASESKDATKSSSKTHVAKETTLKAEARSEVDMDAAAAQMASL